MTHKIVTLRKRSAREKGAAYTETDVPFARSLDEIKKMLRQYGCDKILEYEDRCGGVTAISLAFDNKGTKFLIEFPITYLTNTKGQKALNMNVSGRIIYNKVKALLIDVEFEFLDFSQAMVPYMLLPTPSGKPMTATDILTIENAKDRAQSVMLLLGEAKP